MKKAVFAILAITGFNVSIWAQSYGDSSITLVLTQRAAIWTGQAIRVNHQNWANREAPTQLQQAIGSGTDLDSAFTKTFKAKYLLWCLDKLIHEPLQIAYTDYRAIVLNQPASPNYTGLNIQINNIANGSGPQKNTALWLKAEYEKMLSSLETVYDQQKDATIKWSRE